MNQINKISYKTLDSFINIDPVRTLLQGARRMEGANEGIKVKLFYYDDNYKLVATAVFSDLDCHIRQNRKAYDFKVPFMQNMLKYFSTNDLSYAKSLLTVYGDAEDKNGIDFLKSVFEPLIDMPNYFESLLKESPELLTTLLKSLTTYPAYSERIVNLLANNEAEVQKEYQAELNELNKKFANKLDECKLLQKELLGDTLENLAKLGEQMESSTKEEQTSVFDSGEQMEIKEPEQKGE